MAVLLRRLLGLSLALGGIFGAIAACARPMWKVLNVTRSDIAHVVWEGLWMSCVVQPVGRVRCVFYDSVHAVPRELQLSCILIVGSIVLGTIGILLAAAKDRCRNNIKDTAKVTHTSGMILIISGFLCLMSSSWAASVVIQDMKSPQTPASYTMHMGVSLYLGWAAGALLVLGGALIFSSCVSPQGKVFTKENILADELYWYGTSETSA